MNFQSEPGTPWSNVLIGTAGWQYPDWEGIVYPDGKRRGRASLALLCRWVDLVEINVTYYRPVSWRMCASWVEQTESNTRFRFTAKTPALLTHEHGAQPDTECAAAYRESLKPLTESGKLGGVLLQFPWSFKRTPANRAYLARLADLLEPLPLCVEMRHRSWACGSFFEGLRARGIAFCNIDQPVLRDCVEPSAMVTASFAYVRLHGRNSENWFKEDAGRDARYNYLYSKEELAPWIEKIMAMSQQVNDLYVITNNHYRGQAVVNALELQSSLGIPHQSPPETLVLAYPRLREITE